MARSKKSWTPLPTGPVGCMAALVVLAAQWAMAPAPAQAASKVRPISRWHRASATAQCLRAQRVEALRQLRDFPSVENAKRIVPSRLGDAARGSPRRVQDPLGLEG